jgi:hypothetical protein
MKEQDPPLSSRWSSKRRERRPRLSPAEIGKKGVGSRRRLCEIDGRMLRPLFLGMRLYNYILVECGGPKLSSFIISLRTFAIHIKNERQAELNKQNFVHKE